MAKPDTWMQIDVGFSALLKLEKRPGVYVVIAGLRVIYVGVSNNVRSRLPQHNIRPGYARNYMTPWGMFAEDGFVVKCKYTRRIGANLRLEARLIHRLRPIGNKLGKAKVKCA